MRANLFMGFEVQYRLLVLVRFEWAYDGLIRILDLGCAESALDRCSAPRDAVWCTAARALADPPGSPVEERLHSEDGIPNTKGPNMPAPDFWVRYTKETKVQGAMLTAYSLDHRQDVARFFVFVNNTHLQHSDLLLKDACREQCSKVCFFLWQVTPAGQNRIHATLQLQLLFLAELQARDCFGPQPKHLSRLGIYERHFDAVLAKVFRIEATPWFLVSDVQLPCSFAACLPAARSAQPCSLTLLSLPRNPPACCDPAGVGVCVQVVSAQIPLLPMKAIWAKSVLHLRARY